MNSRILILFLCALHSVSGSLTSIMLAGKESVAKPSTIKRKPSSYVPACQKVLQAYPGETKDYSDIFTCDPKSKSLGKGTFGVVYAVIRQSDNQKFAMKVQVFVHENAVERQLYINQSDKEYKALKKMNHPNVIKVLGRKVFAAPEINLAHATFMEFVPGGDLTATLKNHKSGWADDHPEELLKLFHQMVKGVMHIHEMGFLHRDIKPANVLVLNGVVKIIDLGLCLEEGDSDSAAGTYAYMDPQALDPSDDKFAWGYHADAYSLGVTLHEIFFGTLLYPNTKTEQWRAAINGEPIEIPEGTEQTAAELISGLTLTDCEQRMSLEQADAKLIKFIARKELALLNPMTITSKKLIKVGPEDIMEKRAFGDVVPIKTKKEIESVENLKLEEGGLHIRGKGRKYAAEKTSIEFMSTSIGVFRAVI